MVVPVLVLSEKARDRMAFLSFLLHLSAFLVSVCLITFTYAYFYDHPVSYFFNHSYNTTLVVFASLDLVFHTLGCIITSLQRNPALRWETSRWTNIYIIISVAFLVFAFIAVVVASVFHGNAGTAMQNYDGKFKNGTKDRRMVDMIQFRFRCCGITGYKDYLSKDSSLHNKILADKIRKNSCGKHVLSFKTDLSEKVQGHMLRGQFSCYLPPTCCRLEMGSSCKPTYTLDAPVDRLDRDTGVKQYDKYMGSMKHLFNEGCKKRFREISTTWVSVLFCGLLFVLQTSYWMTLKVPEALFRTAPGWLLPWGGKNFRSLREEMDETHFKEEQFHIDYYNKMESFLPKETRRRIEKMFSEKSIMSEATGGSQEIQKQRIKLMLQKMRTIHNKFWEGELEKVPSERFPSVHEVKTTDLGSSTSNL